MLCPFPDQDYTGAASPALAPVGLQGPGVGPLPPLSTLHTSPWSASSSLKRPSDLEQVLSSSLNATGLFQRDVQILRYSMYSHSLYN